MRLRARLKLLLHSHAPGYRGWTNYFGTRLYFPPGSLSFRAMCEQGIFEQDNLRLAAGLARPDSVIYDVGANIGQIAAPLLQMRPDISVVSFEPSPSSLPWLKRSVDGSPHAARWRLVEEAVGDREGVIDFHLSPPGLSLYESAVHTNRTPKGNVVSTPVTTLDNVWREQGQPDVSLIKIDTEGGETGVLAGAQALIAACRPAILAEWNHENLRAWGILPDTLLAYCEAYDMTLHAAPSLVEVTTPTMLRAAMSGVETFLLSPR